MMSLPVHYGLDIDILQLEVWTIIIWLVIYWVTRLEEGGFDVTVVEYMNGPLVKMSAMVTIE